MRLKEEAKILAKIVVVRDYKAKTGTSTKTSTESLARSRASTRIVHRMVVVACQFIGLVMCRSRCRLKRATFLLRVGETSDIIDIAYHMLPTDLFFGVANLTEKCFGNFSAGDFANNDIYLSVEQRNFQSPSRVTIQSALRVFDSKQDAG